VSRARSCSSGSGTCEPWSIAWTPQTDTCHRQEHGITEHEHDQLLGLFGWTPDEYEEGERAPDDIDLEREKDILKNASGFKVFELRNGQKMTKEEQNVWDRGE
jgi:hypothetical protein